MARHHKPEEIIGKLREAEIVLAQGRLLALPTALYQWLTYGWLPASYASRIFSAVTHCPDVVGLPDGHWQAARSGGLGQGFAGKRHSARLRRPGYGSRGDRVRRRPSRDLPASAIRKSTTGRRMWSHHCLIRATLVAEPIIASQPKAGRQSL